MPDRLVASLQHGDRGRRGDEPDVVHRQLEEIPSIAPAPECPGAKLAVAFREGTLSLEQHDAIGQVIEFLRADFLEVAAGRQPFGVQTSIQLRSLWIDD